MQAYPTLFGCHTGGGGRIVAFGAPYDRGSPPAYAGCALGPSRIRQASAGEHVRAYIHGVYDLAQKTVVIPKEALSDLGDIPFRPYQGDQDYLAQLAHAARLIAAEGKKPLMLGGDHTVTLAALRGMKEAGLAVQVVQLDAHHDYDAIDPGERPTHASFLRFAQEEGLFHRAVQVGVRGVSWGTPSPPDDVYTVPVYQVAATLLPGVPVYLTVDTDGFDPVVAGAVNFPEAEGLQLTDLRSVLSSIRRVAPVCAADWVEYSPRLDTPNSLTARFIVRGLLDILTTMLS